MEDLTEKLVGWIIEKTLEAGCGGVVFGLSGGVDSSVVGVLCQRAFPDNSLGVFISCHSDTSDLEDADLVARKFGIDTVTVMLDEMFDSFIRAFPDVGHGAETKKLAEANVKPRLRMTTLYYYANRLRYLVVGTGNRSEIAVGYSTKYGDGGVDILPLGNLLKSQVREMAVYLGIPDKIIRKPPSAGLWEGQTDEAEMGLSYEQLDRYLETGEAVEEVRLRVDALARTAAHKNMPPLIPPF